MTNQELLLAMGISFVCLLITLYIANKTASEEKKKENEYENR